MVEAPNDQIRELLYAASITRTFSQELLEELTGQPVPSTVFDRLIQLSFVARTAGGWQLHDLVWENLRSMFRERMLGKFDRFCRIAVDLAVKKHVNAMLSKFDLKNRTQLARHVLLKR